MIEQLPIYERLKRLQLIL